MAFYQHCVDTHNRALAQLSRLRTISFIGFACTLFFVDRYPLVFILSLGLLVVFFGLVFRYKKVSAQKQKDETLRDINHRTIARIDRDWNLLADADETHADSSTVFWKDLNIGGSLSVLSLVSKITSPLGFNTFTHWLTSNASVNTITQRQAAHQSLKDDLDFRQSLNQLGLQVQDATQLTTLVTWLQSNLKILPKPGWALFALRSWNFLGAIIVGLFALEILSPLSILAYITVNTALLLRFKIAVGAVYFQIGIKPKHIENLANLSNAIEQHSSTSTHINQLRLSLFSGSADIPFSARLSSLRQLILLSELRLSAIPYILASLFITWDLHVYLRLQQWTKNNTHSFDDCLQAIADFESLSILASLAYENPSWCLPAVSSDKFEPVSITNGGHPLLKESELVRNSLVLDRNNRICVITGSHMSGKTTFLRTLGVNTKLAMIGSVVCAQALTMPRLEILSSMHISDSLLDGVSLFMAEVIKIKTLIEIIERVQLAESNHDSEGLNTLFLLDEVLRGSNDLERKLVFTQLLEKLHAYGGYGLISTNDISIAKSDNVNNMVRQYHFQESIDKEHDSIAFKFDYQLRPGVVSRTNAMQILQSMSVI